MASVLELTPGEIRLWALLSHYDIVTYKMMKEKYFISKHYMKFLVHALRKVIGHNKIVTIPGTGFYLNK